MKNLVQVDLYGMTGRGKTKTEAKAEAVEKITKAMDGTYTPEVIVYKGNAMLLWRELEGWTSRFITDENGNIREGRVWGAATGDDYKKARRDAIRHLVDATARGDFYDESDVPELVENQEDRKELVRNSWWQRAMRHALDVLKLDHNTAHYWASNNCDTPQFSQRAAK